MKNSEYLKALKYNEDDILDDVIVTDIIPDLRSCPLFTLEDEQMICHEITDKAKTRHLLDIIRNRDDELYEKFCDVLRTSNEEIAENLESQNYNRTRRYSNTDFGEILVKGGVPDRNSDYVPRSQLEREILIKIRSSERKPILIQGIIGCGKTSILSNVLHSENLFPSRFLSCCWMTVGNIDEKDVNNKLVTLLKKLDPSAEIPLNNISEIIVDCIKDKLYDETTLLILDDIWNTNILQYFTFPKKYIITSRQSNLFPIDKAELIEIPDNFDVIECNQLLDYYNIESDLSPLIIKKSFKNPLFLSIICKLIQSNSDYIRVLKDDNFDNYHLETILKDYIKVLDDEIKSKFEMLSILEYNETLSLELLTYYWDVNSVKALEIVNKLCNLNFLHKTWNNVLGINLYGVHSIFLKYLQQNTQDLQKFQQIFINNYVKKCKRWLDIKQPDPFFLLFYGKILFSKQNFNKLNELYSDFSFLAAKIVVCGIANLQNEYEKYKPSDSDHVWDDFKLFFVKYGHKFVKLPFADKISIKISKVFINLIQMALYESESSITNQKALVLKNQSNWKDYWKWINPRSSIKVWEINYEDNITYFDVKKNLIIMASEHNTVRLLDFNTSKYLFNYKLSDPVILVKFITDYKFIIIFSNCHFKIFDLDSLLKIENNNDDNGDNDDDYDEVDFKVLNEEPDISRLREQFQHLLIDDFLSKCSSVKLNNQNLNQSHIQAGIFDQTIVFVHNVNNTSHVKYYDFQGKLNDDCEIPFLIKKIILFPSLPGFYVLKEESGEIFLLDEFAKTHSSIIIENEVIIDFVIKKDDIFCAVKNNIYEKRNLVLAIDNDVNIMKISISDNQSLLALCLTNDNVQIWDYSCKTLLYSLNDSKFTDVYFLHDTDYLLTIGLTNAAKWDLKNINLANTNNNSNSDSLSLYRRNFGCLIQSPSSFLLMLQSINNNLELFSYNNETLKVVVINEIFETSCYYFYKNFIFVGFKKIGSIKIYNVKTYNVVGEISGFVEVNEMCSFKTNNNNTLGLLVLCTDEITILYINEDTFSTNEKIKVKIPKNTSNCKFFKNGEGDIKLGLICDKKCILYEIHEKKLHPIKSYDLDNNLFDVDICENHQYLCAISGNGIMKVWDMKSTKYWEHEYSNDNILRKCKFRPKKSSDNWNVVAVINDNAIVSLFYFKNNDQKLKIILDPYETVAIQIPNFIKWSLDGNYVLVGDYNIRKWKVPSEPLQKDDNKLPLTILQTYFGGIQNIHLNENFICTVDQQGFLYILKKID